VNRRALLIWLCLVLGAGSVAGAAESMVSPDRPDVTDNTATVPLGAVQIETGVEYVRARRAGAPAEQSLTLSPTVRAGLGDRLEARLEGEGLIRLRGGEDADRGALGLGLKYRFVDGDSPWPSLGLEPLVRFPIAPARSGRPDVGARALASWELPGPFTLDVNAGMAAVAQSSPGGYLLQALVSASLGWQITARLSGFGELFFASRSERGGGDSLGFDTGLVYLLTPRLGIDAALATLLTGQGPDVAVRAGVSVRLGR
jgi:hypothetical protein